MTNKDYVPYIRKMIGSNRLLTVGLCCLIVNKKNQILLEKRTDNGLYCLPGGSIDFDETVIEGVKREVKEETGITLDKVSLFMILSGNKEQLTYPNGDVTDYVDLIFISFVDEDKQIITSNHDDESSEIKYFDLDKIPSEEEFLRGTLPIIEKYKRHEMELTID